MLELNEKSFHEAIEGEKPVLVDFWASWCMPCKMLAPVLEELSQELEEEAVFCKVNVDENQDLAREYGIMSIPTVIVFRAGEIVEQLVGVQPKEIIAQAVHAAAQKSEAGLD